MSSEILYTIIGSSVILGIFLIPMPYVALKVFKLVNQRAPSFIEALMCITPIENLKLIRTMMYGEAPVYTVLTGVYTIYFCMLIVVRFILGVSTPAAVLLNTLVSIFSAILIPIFYIVSGYCMHDLGTYFEDSRCSFFGLVFYPIGAYLFKGAVERYYGKRNGEL